MTIEEFKKEYQLRTERLEKLKNEYQDATEDMQAFVDGALGFEASGTVTVASVIELVEAVLKMKGIAST